jgi:hypothetical protein
MSKSSRRCWTPPQFSRPSAEVASTERVKDATRTGGSLQGPDGDPNAGFVMLPGPRRTYAAPGCGARRSFRHVLEEHGGNVSQVRFLPGAIRPAWPGENCLAVLGTSDAADVKARPVLSQRSRSSEMIRSLSTSRSLDTRTGPAIELDKPVVYDRPRGRVRPARLRRASPARDAAVRARAARA